jgi:hypothetical protein
MGMKISKYMSYLNLFIGFLLIFFSLVNDLNLLFALVGVLAVLVSSASIYLKRKVALENSNKEDNK